VSGIGFLITLLLVLLKALGLVDLEWLTTFLPVLIAVAFDLFVGIVAAVVVGLTGRSVTRRRK